MNISASCEAAKSRSPRLSEARCVDGRAPPRRSLAAHLPRGAHARQRRPLLPSGCQPRSPHRTSPSPAPPRHAAQAEGALPLPTHCHEAQPRAPHTPSHLPAAPPRLAPRFAAWAAPYPNSRRSRAPLCPYQAPGDAPEDPLRKAADWLRARTGPEARGAVLGDARVDVFRSKDFFRCLTAAKPPFLPTLAPATGEADDAKRVEAQITAVGVRKALRSQRLVSRRAAHSHAADKRAAQRNLARRSCWRRATLRASTASSKSAPRVRRHGAASVFPPCAHTPSFRRAQARQVPAQRGAAPAASLRARRCAPHRSNTPFPSSVLTAICPCCLQASTSGATTRRTACGRRWAAACSSSSSS